MKFSKRALSFLLSVCLLGTSLPVFPAQAVESSTNLIENLAIQPDGKSLTANVTSPEDSLMITALYSADGTTMLGSTHTEVTGKTVPQKIQSSIPAGKGEDGELRLFLLDPETYAPLSENSGTTYNSWMTLDEVTPPTAQTMAYDTQKNIYYVTDTLLVFFDLDASAAEINAVLSDLQGEVIGRDDLLNLFQIRIPTASLEELTARAEQLMRDHSCIIYATYDSANPYSEESLSPASTNDPWNSDVTPTDWSNTTVDGSNWWIEAVKGQYAWSIMDQMDDIAVGIIDSSFDPGHEDLKNQVEFADLSMKLRNNTIPWYTDFDKETDGASSQFNAHGTHVAGIIGAEANNKKGISGLAHHADLLLAPAPARTDSQILTGLTHLVEAGAKVVSMSIGTAGTLTPDKLVLDEDERFRSATLSAIYMADLLEKGYDFLMVQSAGNGRKDGTPPKYDDAPRVAVDAIENGWFCSITDETPCASDTYTIQDVLDRIIIVGAAEQTQNGYQCCYFSDFGDQVTLCAPGSAIYSTIPGNTGTGFEFTGGYGMKSGTSMSTPIVSAICALTWSANDYLTAPQVREIVCSSTDQMVAPSPVADSDMSYHMVNAKLAVEAALKYKEGKIPVTVTVRNEVGNPVAGAAIKINDNPTFTGENITTRFDGTATFFLEEGSYYLSAVSGEYYAAQRLDLTEKTEVKLTMKKTSFIWELDEAGTHLTVNGYGPMPEKPFDTSKWWPTTITSAEIHGVDSISHDAFNSCTDLTEVTLDDSIYNIRYNAFSSCRSLDGIELPEDLFALENEAFRYCDALAEITIPEKISKFGTEIFYKCIGLKKAVFEKGIRVIPSEIFSYCTALTEVTIPAGTTTIDTGAFGYCSSLSSIEIPDSVTTLEKGAFSYTGLTSPTLPDSITTIGDRVFGDCTSLTSITIPSSATSVGGSLFSGCTSLFTVTLPDNLAAINDEMFEGCTSLTSITIPDSVTNIGSGAFNLSGLTTITIPHRVTSIGEKAFRNCDALTTITVPSNVKSIGNYAFANCDSLTTASLLGGSTTAGWYTFMDCIELTSATLGAGIPAVGQQMFSGCKKLTSVTLPSSITSIGQFAFDDCIVLEHISLPHGLTTISSYAFRDCRKLSSPNIPSTVTVIGQNAFSGCKAITSISIPYGVTAIGSNTFSSCSAMVDITIPVTVTTIGNGAFNGCGALINVYYGGSSAQWEAITIGSNNSRLTTKATIHYSA